MGRTMPSECEHGRIFDWGDFGGPDSEPQWCGDCEAEDVAAAVERRLAEGWKPHYGLHCWYRGRNTSRLQLLPGAEQEQMTEAERQHLWPASRTGGKGDG